MNYGTKGVNKMIDWIAGLSGGGLLAFIMGVFFLFAFAIDHFAGK
jgi:hypothetical protein